jgi:hypothetical protein
MKVTAVIDLVYLGGMIALVGLALYLTHASEGRASEGAEAAPEPDGRRPAGSPSH